MALFQEGNSRPAYSRAGCNRSEKIGRRASLRGRRPRWLRSCQTSRPRRLRSATEAGPWPSVQLHPRSRWAAGAGRSLHAFGPPPTEGGDPPWPRSALAALPPARRTDSPQINGHGHWSWARRRGTSRTPSSAVVAAAATTAAVVATVGATCGCGDRECDGRTTMTSGDSGGESSGGVLATGCTALASTGDEATGPVSALAATTALLAPTAAKAPVATRASALSGTLTETRVAEWATSWPPPRLAMRGSSTLHESP